MKHREFSAHVAVMSSVILAVVSVVLNSFRIDTTVLWYIAQCLVYAASMFGVSLQIDALRKIIKSTKNETN